MRWITFGILLYLMAALQVCRFGGIPVAAPGTGTWPYIEFLPMLAVFYALYAAEGAAPLAALLCGLATDVRTPELIGNSMVPLALVGWLIVRIRLSIFREHFISQVVMTLLAVLAYGVIGALFRSLTGGPLYQHSAWSQMGFVAGNAVYTAIVAPMVFFILFRFQGLLGFTSHGPRGRGGLRHAE